MMNGGLISVISTLRRAGLIMTATRPLKRWSNCLNALRKMPGTNLPPLVVFAPSAAKLGEVKPFGLGDRLLLYLSPRLEAKPQSEVDFTVAHESAHILLGHQRPGATTAPPDVQSHEDAPSEQNADRLAESWGFARPSVGRRERKKK
jgi:hypothetical protein